MANGSWDVVPPIYAARQHIDWPPGVHDEFDLFPSRPRRPFVRATAR